MQPGLVDYLKTMFPDIVDLESQTYGRVSPYLDHQNVYIESNVDNDIEILVNLLRDQVLKEASSVAKEGETPRAVIVFCDTKSKLNKICEELQNANIISLPFHGNVKQISLKMRYRTLNLFNDGQVPVLVSDNLGSRGLDTMNVSHVIQFEYAKTAQEYL